MSVKPSFEEMTARLEQTISTPVRAVTKTRAPSASTAAPKAQLPKRLSDQLIPPAGQTETTFAEIFPDGYTARWVITKLRAALTEGRGLNVTWLDDEGKSIPVATKNAENKLVDVLVKAEGPVTIQFVSGPKNPKLTGRRVKPKAERKVDTETAEEYTARLAAQAKELAAPAVDDLFSGISG